MRRSRRLSVAVGPSGSSQFAPKYKYSSSQSTRNSVRTLAGSPSSGLACRKPSWRGAACHASSSIRPSIWMAPPFRLAARATRTRSVSGGNSLRGCASTGVAAASSSKVARIPPLTTAGRREHFSSGSGRCFRMPRGICGAVAEPVSHVRAAEPATPMLRQYHEAKAQARDALLFFRLGDFYELFYEDARIAAQILGITLTSRAKGEDRVPMAGVPHHAAKGYVARLVAAGHTVAICDQMEVPGPGKLVRREIVRLVTPGTLVDEEALEAREPLWLAAVACAEGRAAVALLDASTGELRALPEGSVEEALDELARVCPREVLVSDEQISAAARQASGAVRAETRSFRDAEAAEQFLKRHLGVATLDGFGLRDQLSIEAAAEALAYLQETQRSAAKHVVRVEVEHPGRQLWIDPGAVQNLELFRGPDGRRSGTLLSVVDRTLTASGGRLLSRWLAAPLIDLIAIRTRQDAVEELSQAAVLREEITERLRGVLDVERLLGRLAVGQGTPRDIAGLRASLREMPALAGRLEQCSASLLRDLGPPLRAPAALAELLQRALIDEVPAGREPGFVRPGFRPDLDELTELAQGGRAAIAAMETAEKQRTGIQSLKVRYNKIFGFYI